MGRLAQIFDKMYEPMLKSVLAGITVWATYGIIRLTWILGKVLAATP